MHVGWRGETPDMLTISPPSSDDFSLRVLKRMNWFRKEMAKAEQGTLDVEELKSIRRAILKSLEELKTLHEARH